jgi:4a-hydroxytetrahydrobiopterin dehydratase
MGLVASIAPAPLPCQHSPVALLDDEAIDARLAEHPGWERSGDAIAKTFERGDFVGSVRFVDSIVGPAEGMNHHPDLEISWDKVRVSIATHSEGGITAADFELASRIDALA